MLAAAIVIITLALVFYTIGVGLNESRGSSSRGTR